MNQEIYIANLMEILEHLNRAKDHLEKSFKRCQTLAPQKQHSDDDLIQFEALTSRFARAADMLIHKVFRAIDGVELAEGGTLIDVLNRAEKRRLIDNLSEIRNIKDLRNDIAHEYLTERLWVLYEEVLDLVPKLLDLIDRATLYTERYRK